MSKKKVITVDEMVTSTSNTIRSLGKKANLLVEGDPDKQLVGEKVGVNFLDALPSPMKHFSVNVSKNSIYMSIIFIICMIIFGYIFTSANTNMNGNNNPTKFINYCVLAWIATISAILISQIILSIIGIFIKK